MGTKAKIAAAAAGAAAVVGLVAAYIASLPQPTAHHRPVASATVADPNAELAEQAQIERNYDRSEKGFDRVAKKAHATDTPLTDACTGKSIDAGAPVVDVTPQKCRAAKEERAARLKQRSADNVLRGAEEAVYAIEHECGTIYAKRDQGALSRAVAHLLLEARRRPSAELETLLIEAGRYEMSWFCEGNPVELRRAGRLLAAAERVEDTIRPHNRFLDRARGH